MNKIDNRIELENCLNLRHGYNCRNKYEFVWTVSLFTALNDI